MMEEIYAYVPREMVNFLLVTLFSLLIGLSLRRLNLKREKENALFGTDRTFTFIGILGYLLYLLEPVNFTLYLFGGVSLVVFLAVYYYAKMLQHQTYGLTTIIIALITYCLPPIVSTQPSWFYITLVVTVLLFAEMKHTFGELAQRMKNDEMITLAKFLIISGIILPMLPKTGLVAGINLSPYTVWLATVVVSGISYLSYLLKRYVFHESGIFVSGILGGLYSSTATISVLARKSSHAQPQDATEYVAAMLMAVSMMVVRFLILIGIFSLQTLAMVYPYLLALSLLAAAIGIRLHVRHRQTVRYEVEEEEADSNPLEFKVALIFALLFVLFTVVTHFTLVYTGQGGLRVLSFLAGLSDITPFILNLLPNAGKVSVELVAACTMQAIFSNITVNMCYALFFVNQNRAMRPFILRAFGLVLLVNILLLGVFYLI